MWQGLLANAKNTNYINNTKANDLVLYIFILLNQTTAKRTREQTFPSMLTPSPVKTWPVVFKWSLYLTSASFLLCVMAARQHVTVFMQMFRLRRQEAVPRRFLLIIVFVPFLGTFMVLFAFPKEHCWDFVVSGRMLLYPWQKSMYGITCYAQEIEI